MKFKLENPFKKDPASKIEELEEKIRQEKLKLMTNDERLKSELEHVGGIDGLSEKIREIEKEQYKWAKSALGITLSLIPIYSLANTQGLNEVIKVFFEVVGGFQGFVSVCTASAMIQEWWKLKKTEMLKEEIELNGITV